MNGPLVVSDRGMLRMKILQTCSSDSTAAICVSGEMISDVLSIVVAVLKGAIRLSVYTLAQK